MSSPPFLLYATTSSSWSMVWTMDICRFSENTSDFWKAACCFQTYSWAGSPCLQCIVIAQPSLNKHGFHLAMVPLFLQVGGYDN